MMPLLSAEDQAFAGPQGLEESPGSAEHDGG